MFRLPEDDKRKSLTKIRNQQRLKLLCCIDKCGSPVSFWTGPGSDKLCRRHQIMQREYGGMGRYDRPHTFHRSWICSNCKTNILEDSRILESGLDEKDQHAVARILMHGDHKIRPVDGGDNSAENVNSLCQVCHAIKTIKSKDHIRSPSI